MSVIGFPVPAGRRSVPRREVPRKFRKNFSEVLSTLIIPRILRGVAQKSRAWRAPALSPGLIIISAVA
jgi:hypothetical protein